MELVVRRLLTDVVKQTTVKTTQVKSQQDEYKGLDVEKEAIVVLPTTAASSNSRIRMLLWRSRNGTHSQLIDLSISISIICLVQPTTRVESSPPWSTR